MTIGQLGKLRVVPVKKITDQTPTNCRMPVKEISVTIPEIAEKALPGQFIMMWLLNVDEKPMGIASKDSSGTISFAVAKIGPATTAMHQLQEGDLLGIRGPYGKGFTLQGKQIAIVGGGTGIAPSKFLMEEALAKGLQVTLFHGARTKEELAFRDYFEKLADKKSNLKYKPSTDDGSFGFKGFSTDCLVTTLKKSSFDQLYTCGPELMMYKVWELAKQHKVPVEASLADRYFKCAIGLCGQCTVDPTGLRLCIDGPVLNQDQLAQLADFGKYGRDKFGRKEPF